MMLSLLSKYRKPLIQNQRRPLIGLLIMTAMLSAGCNNNQEPSANDDAPSSHTQSDSTTANAPTDSKSEAAIVSALQKNLKASGIEETITSAVPTAMPGIYWVSADGLPSFFTDAEGKHIIQGQIVQVGDGDPVDISAKLIAQSAKEKLAAVDKKDMVIFPAKGQTKGVIYAFTDADCGYCRKLHQEIDQTNNLGIEVRYLAWPRSEETFPKMEAIWCSQDRQSALTAAKAGANITAANCPNPVQSEWQLGMSLGVRGTPAIFDQNGQQIGGYLPPEQMAAALGIS